jgi:hypothetical protein
MLFGQSQCSSVKLSSCAGVSCRYMNKCCGMKSNRVAYLPNINFENKKYREINLI